MSDFESASTRRYYDVLSIPMHDDSSIGQLIHEVAPANNNQAGLNNGQILKFSYSGDNKVIRLDPYHTGFRVRAAFITQSATGTNSKDANITFSSGWFWHLFSTYKLKVANLDNVENISNPGILADTMNLFKGSEYKHTYGELHGYIPDEGNGEADPTPDIGATCSVKKSDVTAITGATSDEGAGTKAFTVAMNTSKWMNYNKGFIKRMARYNYEVTNDDGVRYIEEFIPLSQISGFFSTDTCLLNTNFEIILTRKRNDQYKNAFFGSSTTDVDFGRSNETGLQSVILELVEQKPDLAHEAKLTSIFNNSDKTAIPIAFLKGTVDGVYQINMEQKYTITDNSHHIPRYVMLVLKGVNNPSDDTANNNAANQSNSCDKNYTVNAHANLESVQVTINGQEFPNMLQDADLSKNQFSKFYQQYVDVCTALDQDPCVTMNEFRDLYFVAAFNCSDQTKKESTKNTNLQVKIKRREVANANNIRKNPRFLEGYLIVLEDQFLKLNAKSGTCSVFSQIA
jgi:hypothetical protein